MIHPAHELTETRKADRHVMLTAVESMVKEYNWTIFDKATEPDSFLGKRACHISFETLRGLSLTIDFDGESAQPNVHVLSWHVNHKPEYEPVKLSREFTSSVNTIHWHKATDVAHGFVALMAILRTRFEVIKTGEGFQ